MYLEVLNMTKSLDELGELSVDDYVDIVRNVWTNIHPRRTVSDYALHVLDHASKLGEAIRRNDADKILKEVAETANWLFAFVAKLNDSKTKWENRLNIQTKFSRMIWEKYPNICPHCFESVYIPKIEEKTAAKDIASEIKGKCKYCLSEYPKVEERSTQQASEIKRNYKQLSKNELRKYAKETLDEIPMSLKEMEAMFHKIYESNTALATLESIGFHVLEEAGEIGRAVIDIYTDKIYTDKREDRSLEEKHHALCDEVAEVFGWLCSLTLKVRNDAKIFDNYRKKITSHFTNPKVHASKELADYVGLEEILWVEYRNKDNKKYRCPYCWHHTCECELMFAWEIERS